MWTKLGTDSITRVELGENDNAVQEFYQYILKQIGDMVEIVKGELDF